MTELRELIELMTGWYDDVQRLETERLIQLLTLGAKVRGLLDRAPSIPGLGRKRAPKDGADA